MWVAQVKDDYLETGRVELVAEALEYVSCKYVPLERERNEIEGSDNDDAGCYRTASLGR